MGASRTTIMGCGCLLFLGALAAVGCGQGGGAQQGGGEQTTKGATTTATEVTMASTVAETPIETIQINETEFMLEPAEINLDKPGTYAFEANNIGTTTHALTIESKSSDEESEGTESKGNDTKEGEEHSTRSLNPGESADLTVDLRPGTYQLYCPIDNHEGRGMTATVTVKGG